MELELCTFNQAKALKELGFSQIEELCYALTTVCDEFNQKHNLGDIVYSRDGYSAKEIVSAPPLELAVKWLREDKNIDLYVRPYFEETDNGTYIKSGYTYEIATIPKECLKVYPNYEEALSVGIDKAIEILKSKQLWKKQQMR